MVAPDPPPVGRLGSGFLQHVYVLLVQENVQSKC